MDRSPNRKELSHERIVEVAARAIRRGGFQGVGVADIMKEAGLTHGGFYAHFRNRDALLVEALEHAGRDTAARLEQRVAQRQARGASAFRALVEAYLADHHLDEVETGCALAALASEVPRQADDVREAAAQRVRGMLAAVQLALADLGAAPEAAQQAAASVASQMVGALQLARTLGANAEGRALLEAARQSLLAQYDAGSRPEPAASAKGQRGRSRRGMGAG